MANMSRLRRREFMKAGSVLTVGLLTGTAHSSETPADMDGEYPSILTSIMKRRSVRHYSPTPVPEEHVRLILEAARMAPTSGNQQPWKFVVTQDTATIAKLKAACYKRSVDRLRERTDKTEDEINERIAGSKEYYDKCFSAPVYVTVLTDNESRYPTYNHWDGPLAAANLMIAARALGYGTVHYTDSVPSEVTKQVLNIPDRYERVCFTPIGVPAAWPDAPPKRPFESFVIQDSF
jgi:nitroreductase